MYMKWCCEYIVEEVLDLGLRWNEGGVFNFVLIRIFKIDDFFKYFLMVFDNE